MGPSGDSAHASALADRVVVITGAGAGIGRATAELFARQGAAVIATSLSSSASDVAAAIADEGGSCRGVRCDVADAEQVEDLMSDVVDSFGRIDVLVNNAARNRDDPPRPEEVATLDLADWNATIATNLTGTFLCSKYALPTMLDHGRGTIINIASLAGQVGIPSLSAYAASKAGVIALTKCMALDYGPRGIRVNALIPNINTRRLKARQAVRQDDPIVSSVPLRRLGEPEEAASVLLFLASDAASYVSGAIVPVDGGLAAMR